MRVEQLDPKAVRPPELLRFRVAQSYTDARFSALKASIANTSGNVQPIKVVPSGDGFFTWVIGSLRWRACLELGLPVLAVIDDQVSLPQAVIELDASNADASLIERGQLYASALDAGLFPSNRRLAQAVARDLSELVTAVDLARLPDSVLACFDDPRTISLSAAKRLRTECARDPQRAFARATTHMSAGRAMRTAEAVRYFLRA